MKAPTWITWMIGLIPIVLTACPDTTPTAQPPSVTITKPTNNANSVVGPDVNNKGVDLEATVSCGFYPCDSVSWSSNLEGALGSGLSLNHVFMKVGAHIITATAKSIAGSSSKSVTLNITNTPPKVTIQNPVSNANITQNLEVSLAGVAAGNNGSGFANQNLCTNKNAAVWTSSNPADTQFPLQGCATSAQFASSGQRTLTLTVTDPFGTVGQASVNVNVSPSAQLGVSITDPSNNSAAIVGDYLYMRSAVVNGVGKITKVWTWKANKQGCVPETLTLEPPISVPIGGKIPDGFWDTTGRQNIAKGCGFDNNGGTLTVTVTDGNNQTASDSITFKLTYVPPPN